MSCTVELNFRNFLSHSSLRMSYSCSMEKSIEIESLRAIYFQKIVVFSIVLLMQMRGNVSECDFTSCCPADLNVQDDLAGKL
eukprot:767503-Hanusia_phi.AAC.3